MFRRVVLPLLTPVTVTAVIILGHISLKIYDLTVAMSPTGPGFATDFPATFMWQISFTNNQFAKGRRGGHRDAGAGGDPDRAVPHLEPTPGDHVMTAGQVTGEVRTAVAHRAPRRFRLRNLTRPAIYAVLLLATLFYIIPVYVLLITGLKGVSEVTLDHMWTLPTSFGFASFADAWKALSPNFLNSVKIAVPAAVLSSMLGSINGYILAKWRFRGSETLFTLILFGMFIPYQAILIPLVQLERDFGLYGTLQGLVIIHIIYGIPITTLIFRNYYVAIPEELVEAARIDGAGFFGIYRRILLPLSVPGSWWC